MILIAKRGSRYIVTLVCLIVDLSDEFCYKAAAAVAAMTAAVVASKLNAAAETFSSAAAASVAEIDRKKIKIYEKK
jgi:hypothetical protein